MFLVPKTPKHCRSILIHDIKTLAALLISTSTSRYHNALVQKLFNAAALAKADNLILTIENQTLCSKAISAADNKKTKSRNEMSKARVISVQDVLSIREEHQKKQKLMQRKM